MTDLLQKLEEKVLMLLTELESLRSEVNLLKNKNESLQTEKNSSINKLKELVSLVDSSLLTEVDDRRERTNAKFPTGEYANA